MALFQLDPFPQREPLPVPPSDPTSIISAISSFYEFLTLLPHIDRSWLHYPPEAGWTSINEEVLRARDRTPQAIDLLKHLPYLYRPAAKKGIEFVPEAMSIAYHEGQVWVDYKHEGCPTPGNVVWLAQMDYWDGMALLLDVDAGTITQFSHQSSGPPLMSMEECEAVVPEDRWMTKPTISVSTYFREARRHYERLVWIPMPEELPMPDRPRSWTIISRYGNEIWDELVEEDDPDFNDDDDVSMGEAEDDADATEDQMAEAYETLDLETDEVSALLEEAGSDGTVFNGQNAARKLTRSVRALPQDKEPSERDRQEKRKWSKLIAIYLRNRWPHDDFDRETCIEELLEWRDLAGKMGEAETLAMMNAGKKKWRRRNRA